MNSHAADIPQLWPIAAPAMCEETAPPLYECAVSILRHLLTTESRWAKVHAAEALIEVGYTREARGVFEVELADHGDQPQYRIGIFRVLARAASDDLERDRWMAEIRGAFLDHDAPDRAHAAETLAKLGYVVGKDEKEAFAREAPLGTAHAVWVRLLLALAGDRENEAAITELLTAVSEPQRLLAAYCLRHLPTLTPRGRDSLVRAARDEPLGSAARLYLMAAVYATSSDTSQAAEMRGELVGYARTGAVNEKYELAMVLAQRGTPADLSVLTDLLNDDGADAQIGAAYAILKIQNRNASHPQRRPDVPARV